MDLDLGSLFPPAAGAAAPTASGDMCKDVPCFDAFDCLFGILGGAGCGYTVCDAFICKN
jgi:hypothetical protein